MLIVPNPPAFLCYSDLVFRVQLEQCAVGSNAVIGFTVMTVPQVLGLCSYSTAGLTCHNDHVFPREQRALVRLATMFPKRSVKSGCCDFWIGHHSKLFIQLSLLRNPLSWTARGSNC